MYLRRYLDDPITVEVECEVSAKKFSVPMKLVNEEKNAEMTSGWLKVVKSSRLEAGDIVLFCFHPEPHGGLYLLIVCLLKEPDFTGVYHPDPYYSTDDDSTDDDSTDDDDSKMKGAVIRIQL